MGLNCSMGPMKFCSAYCCNTRIYLIQSTLKFLDCRSETRVPEAPKLATPLVILTQPPPLFRSSVSTNVKIEPSSFAGLSIGHRQHQQWHIRWQHLLFLCRWQLKVILTSCSSKIRRFIRSVYSFGRMPAGRSAALFICLVSADNVRYRNGTLCYVRQRPLSVSRCKRATPASSCSHTVNDGARRSLISQSRSSNQYVESYKGMDRWTNE
jgi:hypothetical protein